MAEEVLRVVEALGLLQGAAHGGVGAVGADDEVGGRGARGARRVVDEGDLALRKVDRGTALVEADGDIRLGRCCVEQREVERAPRDGVDRARRIGGVGLVARSALDRVDHAAAHADRVLHDGVFEAGAAEGLDAAGADREVDRTTGGESARAGVAAALDEFDGPPRAGEVDGEEAAGEAGTDDENTAWGHGRMVKTGRETVPGACRLVSGTSWHVPGTKSHTCLCAGLLARAVWSLAPRGTCRAPFLGHRF